MHHFDQNRPPYAQDQILNVCDDDEDDNEENHAIDIHEDNVVQCGSVYLGRLPRSGALSVRRHCSHVKCGHFGVILLFWNVLDVALV